MTEPSDDKLAELARLVDATGDQEICCAEMLDRVAVYLEAVRAHADMTEQLQLVAKHLQICPECYEEFVALIKAEGLDPSAILPERHPS